MNELEISVTSSHSTSKIVAYSLAAVLREPVISSPDEAKTFTIFHAMS